MNNLIAGHLDEVSRCLRDIDLSAIQEIVTLLSSGASHAYVLGNGGSAATAQHFAFDLDRYAPIMVSFPVNITSLTAISNDDGYERAFTLATLKQMVVSQDILFLISTSGDSENVVHAANVWKHHGNVIALTGPTGGELKQHADILICVQSGAIEVIEDCHSAICHSIVRHFRNA